MYIDYTQLIAEILLKYGWVPPVIVGLTQWVKSLLASKLTLSERDVLLPAVALVVCFGAVYGARWIPPGELKYAIAFITLWLTTSGLVKWDSERRKKETIDVDKL